ncbi:MAG: UxaA family hydrolase [Chloroflexi bacterium]|nr:UxaA family hydrolase [Chloroflexota bacterium]
MKNNALQINGKDNVAIAINPIRPGDYIVVNNKTVGQAIQDIEPSHKVALVPVKKGENIIRYGEPIVRATCDVKQGEWVHTHNTEPIPISYN